jgi:nucleotide-binding universal stress UspA family protein
MAQQRSTRILVVTDHAVPSDALLEAIVRRAETGDVQFRIVVPNPARAELHLLHPERHDRAHEAEAVLRQAQPLLERAAGGSVIGTVSVRNDPMDAIEETIFNEPIDEIMLSIAPHGLSTRLHQDLAHRLQHFGLPVTVVAADAASR